MSRHIQFEGWVKTWRQIQGSWQWQNPRHLKMWIWLVLNAEDTGSGELKKGQIICTERELAKECGVSRSVARTFLARCEKNGDITREIMPSHRTIRELCPECVEEETAEATEDKER